MKNRAELLKKLSKDVKSLENKIEHRTLYNIRNYVISALLKSGIAIDYALPFILCATIIACSHTAKGNAPFRFDNVTQKAGIETIDTSNGIHIEHISYDYNYNDEILEYSTGWTLDENGLYQRTVTSYRISDKINIEDVDSVLSMSKEEIDNLLIITNIKTIRKNTLTSEDEIYNSDAIIIVNHIESEDEFITRTETLEENVFHSVCFVLLSLYWGYNLSNIGKIFVKTHIRDRLREYEPLFKQIDKKELEIMKKILEMKKNNLAMIYDSTSDINTRDVRSYRLRKI